MFPDFERRYAIVVDMMPIALCRGEMCGVHENADGTRPFHPVADKILLRLIANAAECSRASLWLGNRMLHTPRPFA